MKIIKSETEEMFRIDKSLPIYTYIQIIQQLTESLGCDITELIDAVNELNLVERWLLQECKEPTRSEAIEWLSKFGYEVDNG